MTETNQTTNTHHRKRAAMVAGLRALADDIERSTALLPTHVPVAQWLIFGDQNQKETAAQVVRSLGGHWDKGRRHGGGDLFDFTKEYGGGVRAEVVVDRDEVCERVVVRTETVTIPATDLQVIEPQPERTETREVVEWRCAPLLTDTAPSDEDEDPTPIEQWEVTTPAAVYATGDELEEPTR
ncbi:hypothetical protein [Nocardioides sp. Arc9.136]|uniref:hypothetical protein n=1 Tax=Nocardioides sp. Arc9.136 TaxID=2996826 RepID=UPI002665E3F9|nr:hypothetical protein [Nocardioides sp. Arc9.136]WKN47114.1 hypothetical protein OSR43_13810 [Nocardioides sp. Arc9.136]